MEGEISIIHSFSEGKSSDPALQVHCIVYTSRIHASGRIGGKYFRV